MTWRERLIWIGLFILGLTSTVPQAQVTIQRGWTQVSDFLGFGPDLRARRSAAGTLDLDSGTASVFSTTVRAGAFEGSWSLPVLRSGTNVTLTAADAMVASATGSGPWSVTLPSPTAFNKRVVIIHDQAGLASGVNNRTITITGLVNAGNNTTITTAFGVARLIGGVTSGSAYSWFTW